MKMRFLLVLERLRSIFKRFSPAFAEAPARRTRLRQAGLRAGRPKPFFAGPPTPLDLAFLWISVTGKEMVTFRKTQWYFGRKRVKIIFMFNGGKR